MIRPYKTFIELSSVTIDLTTVAAVKANLDITDAAQDAWLQEQVTTASAIIATQCDRYFQKETLTDYFDVRHHDWHHHRGPLLLSRTPVTDILEVIESGSVLSADDFDFDPATGFVWRLTGVDHSDWTFGPILVTFEGGYELLTTLPRDIERACVLLVSNMYLSKSQNPTISAENIPGVVAYNYRTGSVVGERGLPMEVDALIAPYRCPVVV